LWAAVAVAMAALAGASAALVARLADEAAPKLAPLKGIERPAQPVPARDARLRVGGSGSCIALVRRAVAACEADGQPLAVVVHEGIGSGGGLAAIRAVALGHAFLTPAVAALLVNEAPVDTHSPQARLRHLSTREQEVLRWVVLGKTSSEIGDLLGISTKTVEAHRANLGAKLDLHDVPALVRFAIRAGLISSDS